LGLKPIHFYLDKPHAKAWGYMNSLTIGTKADSLSLINPMLSMGYMNGLTIGAKADSLSLINPMLKHGVI
jgi:hypothetical protein